MIHPETPAELESTHGLDSVVVEAMMAAETRPRILVRSNGIMVILRAMNMHTGADAEDMISQNSLTCFPSWQPYSDRSVF